MRTETIGRGSQNELWHEIDSTNTRVATMAKEGAPEGVVVFARQQTAGRGRLGRKWVSPPDSGLYMSLLLRPEKEVGEIPVITLGIGVAAARAIIAVTGVRMGLKWVNDLVFDGKKVGGILAEMTMVEQQQNALIIGIGVNIKFNQDEIPDDLKNKMLGLEEIAGTTIDTSQLAAEICYQVEESYNLMLNGESRRILDQWRTFSVTLGNEIVSTTPAREVRGLAIDIADSGALIVQTVNGREEILGGEISIRSADGSYC